MGGNPRDEMLRLEAEERRYLARLDREMARQMARDYEQARLELLGWLNERRAAVARGGWATAADERLALLALARDEVLFRQVDARTLVLRSQILSTTQATWARAQAAGAETGAEQLRRATRGLEIALRLNLARVDFTSVEIGLQEALRALEATDLQLAAALRSGLRTGLLMGEAFEDLAARVLGGNESLFSRGYTSALLGARRSVIYANNAARDLVYQEYATEIPGLQKQAVAAIGPKTTDCCLQVHGQIQMLEQPYRLTGTPRFAGEMMYPPFHWNCRTSSVAYHPDFERGSRVTTEAMRAAAREEAKGRSAGVQRET